MWAIWSTTDHIRPFDLFHLPAFWNFTNGGIWDLKRNSFSEGPLWKISPLCPHHSTSGASWAGYHVVGFMSFSDEEADSSYRQRVFSHVLSNKKWLLSHWALDVSKTNTHMVIWTQSILAWIHYSRSEGRPGTWWPQSPCSHPSQVGRDQGLANLPFFCGGKNLPDFFIQRDLSPCSVAQSAVHTLGLYWLESGVHLPEALELRGWRRILSVLVGGGWWGKEK